MKMIFEEEYGCGVEKYGRRLELTEWKADLDADNDHDLKSEHVVSRDRINGGR